MQVVYDHPPRRLSFYLRFIFTILIIIIPIFIVLPVLYSDIPLAWLLILIAIAVLVRISSIAKQALQWTATHTDYGVPKTADISKLGMDVPSQLEDTKLLLELEGFERLGEQDNYHASTDKPVPSWLFSKANGKIIAEALAIKDKTFMAFTTTGEDGMVMTVYPVGHRLQLENAFFSGVNTSIEDVYKYHLKQVKRMRPKIGRLVPVRSVKHFMSLELKNSELSKAHTWLAIRDQIIAQTAMSVAVAMMMGVLASWWLPEIFGSLYDFELERSVTWLVIFFGTLIFGAFIESRKNGISNINKD